MLPSRRALLPLVLAVIASSTIACSVQTSGAGVEASSGPTGLTLSGFVTWAGEMPLSNETLSGGGPFLAPRPYDSSAATDICVGRVPTIRGETGQVIVHGPDNSVLAAGAIDWSDVQSGVGASQSSGQFQCAAAWKATGLPDKPTYTVTVNRTSAVVNRADTGNQVDLALF